MSRGREFVERVAVVTGAGRGIGAAIARRLAEMGAHVVVADVEGGLALSSAEALRFEGLAATALAVDMSEERSVEALADHARSLGPLAAWVNNAGISSRVGLLEMELDDWDRMMAVNARGTFLGTRAAGRRMERGAAIVNVASMSAQIALPNHAHYGASKGAVVAFTKHAAVDLGPRGIRVNAVAPGTIETAMTAPRLERPGERVRASERLPLRRIGEPDDIAGAVAFLCGPDSAYLTGTTLFCDGGWTASA